MYYQDYPDYPDYEDNNKFYVEPGEVVKSAIVSGASQMILPGGIAEDTRLIAAFTSDSFGGMSYSCARQYIANGGKALRTEIYSGAVQHVSGGAYAYDTKVISGVEIGGTMVETSEQRISSGGVAEKTELHNGALQYILEGGSSINCDVSSGSLQMVNGGAHVSGAIIRIGGVQQFFCKAELKDCVIDGGVQYVRSGAITSDTVCRASGSQVINPGGMAFGCIIESGGSQIVSSGGIVDSTVIGSGGSQILYSGARVSSVLLEGGSQFLMSGITASGTKVCKGATVVITTGATASALTVSSGNVAVSAGAISLRNRLHRAGKEQIFDKGAASGTIVSSGGLQTVFAGGKSVSTLLKKSGKQIVSSGGVAQKTFVSSGASQIINRGGIASGGIIRSQGRQYVSSGGIARQINVYSKGIQFVLKNGTASRTSILAGGSAVISSGGKAFGMNVGKNGILLMQKGSVASNLAMQAGATLRLSGTVSFMGSNTFTGIRASGAQMAISLGKNARLVLTSNNKLGKTVINGGSGTLVLKGVGNSAGKYNMGAKGTTLFDISAIKASAAPMMHLAGQTKQVGKVAISTAKSQQMGAYKLATGFAVSAKTAVSLQCGSTKVGNLKANGAAVSKNGIKYALKSTATQTTLTLSIVKGVVRKGSGKLAGTANCDIFYGNSGNNTINGGNGRDVAVYTTAKWGKDTINAVSGDMTILFSGIKAADVTKKLVGKNMVITRKTDASQKITVKNWNAATHRIVFGGTLTNFNKFISAAKPTTAQKNLACNEVWKKAGILA